MIRPVRLVRELVPGVYWDSRARVHVDVPECLRLEEIEDTPANRRRWTRRELRILRGELPRVLLIAHLEGLTS
jgi:hypothetical protein